MCLGTKLAQAPDACSVLQHVNDLSIDICICMTKACHLVKLHCMCIVWSVEHSIVCYPLFPLTWVLARRQTTPTTKRRNWFSTASDKFFASWLMHIQRLVGKARQAALTFLDSLKQNSLWNAIVMWQYLWNATVMWQDLWLTILYCLSILRINWVLECFY